MPSIAFQFTRLLRGATIRNLGNATAIAVSIHAPLARRDDEANAALIVDAVFQFTRLLRGATG